MHNKAHNTFTHRKCLQQTTFEAPTQEQSKSLENKIHMYIEKSWKQYGKWRTLYSLAVSSFASMFFKSLLLQQCQNE